jgi:hypothetical protein
MLCSCPPLKDIVLLLVISVVHPGWPPPHPQPPAGPGGGAQKNIRSLLRHSSSYLERRRHSAYKLQKVYLPVYRRLLLDRLTQGRPAARRRKACSHIRQIGSIRSVRRPRARSCLLSALQGGRNRRGQPLPSHICSRSDSPARWRPQHIQRLSSRLARMLLRCSPSSR